MPDRAGQYRVGIRHHAHIVGIISAEIGKIVGEVLAAREMLAEIGEAGGERMPPRIDDPRTGRISLMKPTKSQLFGSLSMKKGRSVFRCGATRAR